MIYTKMTKLAMNIAYEAHKGQMDQSGVPYIFHPIHLAEQMIDEDTTITALLHDVVEDTDITLNDLDRWGFSSRVIEAIALLTHDKSVEYMDYVKEIKTNPIATTVKIADLNHNRDATRLDKYDDRAKAWEEKYSKALAVLIR